MMSGAASFALRKGMSALALPLKRKLLAAASADKIPKVSFCNCTRKADERAATAAVWRSLSWITLPDRTQITQKEPS